MAYIIRRWALSTHLNTRVPSLPQISSAVLQILFRERECCPPCPFVIITVYRSRTRTFWFLFYTLVQKLLGWPCVTFRLSDRQTFSEVSAILQDDSYVQEGSVKLPSLCTCMQEQQDVLCCFSHNFWMLLCCVNECICVQGLIWCGRYECVMVLLTVDVLCGSNSCLLS